MLKSSRKLTRNSGVQLKMSQSGVYSSYVILVNFTATIIGMVATVVVILLERVFWISVFYFIYFLFFKL
jgi:hypothetical protein